MIKYRKVVTPALKMRVAKLIGESSIKSHTAKNIAGQLDIVVHLTEAILADLKKMDISMSPLFNREAQFLIMVADNSCKTGEVLTFS